MGGRAGDRERPAGAARGRSSRPTATAAARAGWCSRSTCRGRRPRRRRCGSPTTSGARTSSTRRSAGTSRPWRSSTGAPATSRRMTCAPRSSCRRTSAATLEWLRELAGLGFDEMALHHVGQDLDPFIDAFGEHVLPAPPMSVKATSDLWWKNAVFYCLDVETFYDFDGDGCGDLAGLTERVDYLGGLGVSCIWLMPFYRSPNRDDGYDIVDFYAVDPAIGTLGDFVEFVRTARDRGIRVDRRLRDEPHLGPAPVVPVGAREPRLAVPRLLRLARREARREAGRRRLPRPGELELGLGREGPPVLPAPLLLPSARPERRQPARCATSSRRSWRSGSSRACPGSASTRCRS